MNVNLTNIFAKKVQLQLFVIPVYGFDTSKYCVEVSNGLDSRVDSLIQKSQAIEASSNLFLIGQYVLQYVLKPSIFCNFRRLGAGLSCVIKLVDAMKMYTQKKLLSGFMQASRHEYYKRLVI